MKNDSASREGTAKAGGLGSTGLAMLRHGRSSHPAKLDKLSVVHDERLAVRRSYSKIAFSLFSNSFLS